MAKKGRRAVILEEEDTRPLESEVLAELEDEKEIAKQQALEEWLGDFQSRFTDQPVKVQIEKFEDGEWSICRKYPLASFDHEAVREEFGGGRYRATLFDPKGKYIKEGRNSFKFAEAKRPANPKPENPLENPLLALMLKSQEESSRNMMLLTQSMIQAQGAGAGKGESLSQLIEALVKVQTLTPKAEKPLDNFKETLGIMKLVKEISGSEEGESKGGLLSEIKEFLEIWPQIKDHIPQVRGITSPSLPVPAPAVSAPVTPPAKGPEQAMDPLTQKVIALIPQFTTAAKANAPVDAWKDHLFDILDEEIMPVLLPQLKAKYGPLIENEDDVYDLLYKYAKNPETRSQIYQSIPPLAPYRVWCDQVIDAALQDLTDEASQGSVITHALQGKEANGSQQNPA